MHPMIVKTVTAAFFAAAIAAPLSAEDLAQPAGDVILTVSGNIDVTNQGDTATFDIDMLKELGATNFETTTIWTEGVQNFTGVELATLLARLGVDSGTLKATAVNDYSVELPIEGIMPGGALVAYENNGAAMTVRDKGPLWIVFPYDSSPDFQTEVIYSQSIWQLDRLEVLE